MLSKLISAVLAFISSLFGFAAPPTNSALPSPTIFLSPTPAANITLVSPLPNQQIDYLLIITGQARVFENQFQWRLKDGAGTVIVSGVSQTDATDAGIFGNYVITTSYPLPVTPKGLVEVYESSAKDGSEINLVSVPVQFPVGPATKLEIYFGKYSPLSTMEPCEKVYPVTRYVPHTTSVAQAAINQLLLGLTTPETSQYFSSINPGVRINKLVIENGVAKVDFSKELGQGVAGACKVTHIRTQITRTLKQFPTIKDVVISIDGNSSDILQP